MGALSYKTTSWTSRLGTALLRSANWYPLMAFSGLAAVLLGLAVVPLTLGFMPNDPREPFATIGVALVALAGTSFAIGFGRNVFWIVTGQRGTFVDEDDYLVYRAATRNERRVQWSSIRSIYVLAWGAPFPEFRGPAGFARIRLEVAEGSDYPRALGGDFAVIVASSFDRGEPESSLSRLAAQRDVPIRADWRFESRRHARRRGRNATPS